MQPPAAKLMTASGDDGGDRPMYIMKSLCENKKLHMYFIKIKIKVCIK